MNIIKKNRTSKRKQSHGFTLIEILFSMGIVGVLTFVVFVFANKAEKKAHDNAQKATLIQIRNALDLYYNDHGSYPLSPGVYFTEPRKDDSWLPGLVPQYMAHAPIDPITGTDQYDCTSENTGFRYRSDGTDYEILDSCTAMEFPVAEDDPFYEPNGLYTSYVIYTPGAKYWANDSYLSSP